MKHILLLLLVLSTTAYPQVTRRGGGGSVDSANFAKQTDLLHDASNASEMPYVDGDTIRSRPFYSPVNWTLDSTVLSLYGTRLVRGWFRTSADSLAVDSLVVVLQGAVADTVSLRVLWGVSRATATDSLADIKCYSLTVGTSASSTKVIPPYRWVWVKVTEKDGAPVECQLSLNARREIVVSPMAVAPPSAPSGVFPDAVSDTVFSGTGAKTITITVGTLTNGILAVFGNAYGDGDPTRCIDSVKVGTTKLTLLDSLKRDSNYNNSSIWYLLSPSAGSISVVVHTQGLQTNVSCASFSGVSQSTPWTATGENFSESRINNPSVSYSSASGQLALAMINTDTPALSITPGASQTLVSETGGSYLRHRIDSKAGETTVAFSWTLGASRGWHVIGAALRPAP